jgi:hypothetical protein
MNHNWHTHPLRPCVKIIMKVGFLAIVSACSQSMPLQTPSPVGKPMPSRTVTSTPIPVPESRKMPAQGIPQSALLYSIDFEAGRTVDFPGWQIKDDGTGNHVLCNPDSPDGMGNFFGNASWSNYAVEASMFYQGAGDEPYAWLAARFNPTEYVGYYGALNFQTSIVDLALNEPYRNLGTQSLPTAAQTWYTLRLETAADRIRFYIDNRLFADARSEARKQGMAGIQASSHLQICVDDIRVWALTDDGQIGSAPTPIPSTPTQTNTPYLTPTIPVVPNSALLFLQDFEGEGLEDAAVAFPAWDVRKEESGNHIFCNNTTASWQTVVFGDAEWTNYALEVRVKAISKQNNGYASVFSRFNPGLGVGYQATLNYRTHEADLAFPDPYTLFGRDPFYGEIDHWYTMRVEAAGDTIRYALDNRLIGEGTATLSGQGRADLAISPGLQACFDDIRVWALTPEGTIGRSPVSQKVVDVYFGDPPIFPEVWSYNGPEGQSYEFKVNCGSNYPELNTCFLWHLDQVVVTVPDGTKYSLKKDFAYNSYSTEIGRRWVLYGPNNGGLPSKGVYQFDYIRGQEIVFSQTVDYKPTVVPRPTNVKVKQEDGNLFVSWDPPIGADPTLKYKVILFTADGKFATSMFYPAGSTKVVMVNPPLIQGATYTLSVGLGGPSGYSGSDTVQIIWRGTP